MLRKTALAQSDLGLICVFIINICEVPVRMIAKEMQGKKLKKSIYRKYVSLGLIRVIFLTVMCIYTFLIWLLWWLSWCLPFAENCFPYASAGSGPDPGNSTSPCRYMHFRFQCPRNIKPMLISPVFLWFVFSHGIYLMSTSSCDLKTDHKE